MTAAITWVGQALVHRKEWRKMELDHAAMVGQSRDGLAIELLSSARAEVVTARAEMESLRDEMKALRAMELHFYHFQQAIDHLTAVMFAKDTETREVAERNARAFLSRMTRLQEAKDRVAGDTAAAANGG